MYWEYSPGQGRWGSRRLDFTPGSDASVVHDEKKIAVTPISFKHQESLFGKSQIVLDNL